MQTNVPELFGIGRVKRVLAAMLSVLLVKVVMSGKEKKVGNVESDVDEALELRDSVISQLILMLAWTSAQKLAGMLQLPLSLLNLYLL